MSKYYKRRQQSQCRADGTVSATDLFANFSNTVLKGIGRAAPHDTTGIGMENIEYGHFTKK